LTRYHGVKPPCRDERAAGEELQAELEPRAQPRDIVDHADAEHEQRADRDGDRRGCSQ
jgi:hypothetical protein